MVALCALFVGPAGLCNLYRVALMRQAPRRSAVFLYIQTRILVANIRAHCGCVAAEFCSEQLFDPEIAIGVKSNAAAHAR